MTRRGRYPREVRDRAVRMVLEHQDEYPSQWAAIISIAGKFGMTCETLRRWVRQVEVDVGERVARDDHEGVVEQLGLRRGGEKATEYGEGFFTLTCVDQALRLLQRGMIRRAS